MISPLVRFMPRLFMKKCCELSGGGIEAVVCQLARLGADPKEDGAGARLEGGPIAVGHALRALSTNGAAMEPQFPSCNGNSAVFFSPKLG